MEKAGNPEIGQYKIYKKYFLSYKHMFCCPYLSQYSSISG